mgnify:CR=1 FL=1
MPDIHLPRSKEWFREPQNWQEWSIRVNLKFIASLSLKLAKGTEPGQAVNDTIRSFIADMTAENVPPEILVAFVEQYLTNRATLLASAAMQAEQMHS